MIAPPPPFACHVDHVHDGDTWRCGETIVRLARVDAADSSSSPSCRFHHAHAWCDDRMAAIGRVELTRLIAGRTLRCTPVSASPRGGSAYDRYGRIVARCSVNGVDVGGYMVRHGWALRWPHG